ncbi:hypothetical protein QWY31_05035 [Cytophagales bacterium LB-30]|uniref:Lipoprotein n=1 Tax=Shiella aurantiaca TaxID=3058365 RepID=A0ABT8F3B5_9BACT|nr:hypothetical protein [Shiella aurantiaca]MDN4164854.1 hypothetical protein [Shiella aurantiaca]
MKNLFQLFVALAVLSACNRLEETQDNIDSSEVNSIAENEFNSVLEMVDDETASGTPGSRVNSRNTLPECASVSYNQATRTLTINFGNENCLCLDGIYRRGSIVAVFTGEFREVGSTSTITLENYYVNDNHFQGTKTYELLNVPPQNLKWQVSVSDASIETEAGTFTWEADRTVERISGNDTPFNFSDDVYLVEGTATGQNRRGTNYESVITTPLKKVRQSGCARVFVSGVVELTNEGGQTLVLDYDPLDDEACDRLAEVTINGRTRQITLR